MTKETSSKKKTKPTDKEIQERAYELWEKDGKPEGNDGRSYWYEAEKQLTSE